MMNRVLSLQQQLAEAEREIAFLLARPVPIPTEEQIFRRLMDLECEPLRNCSPKERAQIRIRLSRRYHPDKAGLNESHIALSTRLFQALTANPLWTKED